MQPMPPALAPARDDEATEIRRVFHRAVRRAPRLERAPDSERTRIAPLSSPFFEAPAPPLPSFELAPQARGGDHAHGSDSAATTDGGSAAGVRRAARVARQAESASWSRRTRSCACANRR